MRLVMVKRKKGRQRGDDLNERLLRGVYGQVGRGGGGEEASYTASEK